MKILVINGGYRKGRTIDTLIEKAIEGAGQHADISVERIRLIEKDIKYCTNCMVCRKDDPEKEIADCPIKDDMEQIFPMIQGADAFIFATPINMGNATAVMKTFLERTCWTLAKAGNKPFKGVPVPRNKRQRKAILIMSSGLVPRFLRRFCDDATPLFKSCCQTSFGAKVVGCLYAGAVEKKGVECFFNKANQLGRRLTAKGQSNG